MRALRSAFFVALLAAAPALAQNVLVDPSFESGLTFWPASAGSVGTASPEATTVHNGAGSAKIVISGVSGLSSIEQCVAVTNGASYAWGAWSFVPSGQSGSNMVQVYWCNSASCTSCGSSPGGVSSTLTNAWERIGPTTTTAGDNFAKLVVRSIASTTAGFTGYFDDAFLGIGITPASLVRFSAD